MSLARRGIRTADEAIDFTSALIGDAMMTDVKESTAGVAIRGVESMRKMHEAKQKYAGGKDFAFTDRPSDRDRRLEMLEAELKELRAMQD